MEFAATVWVRGTSWMAFIQGEVLRLSVNRGAVAEHERLDLSPLHCLQRADSALYVVSGVVSGL
jgi:hypothetical protein